MGDTNTNSSEEPKLSSAETSPAPNINTSIEILRETKPSENISINSPLNGETQSPNLERPAFTETEEKTSNIETVFEKLDISDKSDSNSDSAATADAEKDTTTKTEVQIPPLNFDIKEKIPTRNKSDIFGITDDKIKQSNTIFSIKGTPSGRINRRKDITSTVFPVGCMGCKEDVAGDDIGSSKKFLDAKQAAEYQIGHINSTPRRKPSNDRVETARNPLTGEGVSSNDELKKTYNGRRRDGNPLLGIGYDSNDNRMPSSTRVPPGGHSKGLW